MPEKPDKFIKFEKQEIAATNLIEESGKGVRFNLRKNDETFPAFAIRFGNELHAYLNICGHIAVQLDYAEGQFFSDEGNTLMCATHGAEYAPDTGKCLSGPCFGVGLTKLDVQIENDILYLINSNYEIIKSVVLNKRL